MAKSSFSVNSSSMLLDSSILIAQKSSVTATLRLRTLDSLMSPLWTFDWSREATNKSCDYFGNEDLRFLGKACIGD